MTAPSARSRIGIIAMVMERSFGTRPPCERHRTLSTEGGGYFRSGLPYESFV